MLNILAAILIILWLLDLLTSYTIGGIIHIVLILAVILFLVRIILGRSMVQIFRE